MPSSHEPGRPRPRHRHREDLSDLVGDAPARRPEDEYRRRGRRKHGTVILDTTRRAGRIQWPRLIFSQSSRFRGFEPSRVPFQELRETFERSRQRIAAHPTRWTIALILILSAVVYRGAFDASFTHWDDDVYVTRNPEIRELDWEAVRHLFTTTSNCNYHPLTYLTWMGEYALVGASPWLYHLDNVVLHALTAILVYMLSRRLLRSAGGGALAALLFLVHPLRVESVAWVAERKDVLCAFFYVAGLAVYLRFIDGPPRRLLYLLAVLLHAAALLSKAMAMTFPAVLVLLLLYRRRLHPGQLALLLPFFALAGAFGTLAYVAQAELGAIRGLHGGDLVSHVLTIPKAFSFYLYRLLFPVSLSPRYVMEPAEHLLEPAVIVGLGLLGASAIAFWLSFHAERHLFLGLGFFAVAWAPVSGIVPTSTIVADRYMYLPALGLLWPLCAMAVRNLRMRPAYRSPHRVVGVSVLTTLLVSAVGWGLLAERKVHAWEDGVTLWEDALRENPYNPYAYNQLAVEHLAAGRYAQAAACAVESVRLGLREPRFLFNLCLAYRGLGDLEREEATASGILAGAPDFLPAWGVALRRLRERGKLEECSRRIEDLLERFPGAPTLFAARGDLRLEVGELHEARNDYLAALAARPQDREVILSLAVATIRLGELQRAMALTERAMSFRGSALSPGEVRRVDQLVRFVETHHPEARRLLEGIVRGTLW